MQLFDPLPQTHRHFLHGAMQEQAYLIRQALGRAHVFDDAALREPLQMNLFLFREIARAVDDHRQIVPPLLLLDLINQVEGFGFLEINVEYDQVAPLIVQQREDFLAAVVRDEIDIRSADGFSKLRAFRFIMMNDQYPARGSFDLALDAVERVVERFLGLDWLRQTADRPHAEAPQMFLFGGDDLHGNVARG